MIQVGEHIVQTSWFNITNPENMFSCRFQLSRRVHMESARVVWLKMCLICETTRWRSNDRLFVIIWLQWWFHRSTWLFFFHRACMQPVGPNQPHIQPFMSTAQIFCFNVLSRRRCLSSMPFKRAGAHNCWDDRSLVNPVATRQHNGQQKWVGPVEEVSGTLEMLFCQLFRDFQLVCMLLFAAGLSSCFPLFLYIRYHWILRIPIYLFFS